MDIERFIKVLSCNQKTNGENISKIRSHEEFLKIKTNKLLLFSNINFQNQMFDKVLVHNASFKSCFLQ